MEITPISDIFSTCGQIESSDVAEIKSLGFRSIICARPDGEAEGQSTFDEIKAQADAHGLDIWYVPVHPSGATEANHAAFSQALADLPGPILGYCRSGQRAAMLWHALNQPVR